MKLSSFPVERYLSTSFRHWFSDEWSRPGLTNFLGSVQCDADPTALRHPIFPPVSSAEEWTGFLTINGTFLPSSGVEVDVRWCPWQVRRTAIVGVWKIESVLAMVQRRLATSTSSAGWIHTWKSFIQPESYLLILMRHSNPSRKMRLTQPG